DLILQPGVQYHVGPPGHALGPPLASGWAEQGQQLGGAPTDVFVRLTARLALTLPGLSGLWDGLIRAGLVLAPQRDAHRFGDAIGEVDQAPFFLRSAGRRRSPRPTCACVVPSPSDPR